MTKEITARLEYLRKGQQGLDPLDFADISSGTFLSLIDELEASLKREAELVEVLDYSMSAFQALVNDRESPRYVRDMAKRTYEVLAKHRASQAGKDE